MTVCRLEQMKTLGTLDHTICYIMVTHIAGNLGKLIERVTISKNLSNV